MKLIARYLADLNRDNDNLLRRLDSQMPGGLSSIIVFSLAAALVVTWALWR